MQANTRRNSFEADFSFDASGIETLQLLVSGALGIVDCHP